MRGEDGTGSGENKKKRGEGKRMGGERERIVLEMERFEARGWRRRSLEKEIEKKKTKEKLVI